MKGTDQFKRAIEDYLLSMIAKDSSFASVYAKPNKNLDDCVTYILNEVKKSGCNGFADDEIYGMAVHYYQEDDINVGKPLNCDVRINHHVEPAKQTTSSYVPTTAKQARQMKKKAAQSQQPTLFDNLF